MAKVVLRPTKMSSEQKGKVKSSGQPKRALAKRGSKTILSVEARSFGDDLDAVFKRNVAKARRENKRVVGAPDRVPAKA